MTRARAAAQPHLDPGHVADAAAELDRDRNGAEDRLDARPVDGPAFGGAVQIDDMQPAETLGLEARRLVGRIVVEDGFLREVALEQPDAAAVLEVDGRIQDHPGPPVPSPDAAFRSFQ